MAERGAANCEVIISSGKEAEILKFIKEGSVELMVMKHGHNRLREWLLGSTSTIIQKSPVPVLLIR